MKSETSANNDSSDASGHDNQASMPSTNVREKGTALVPGWYREQLVYVLTGFLFVSLGAASLFNSFRLLIFPQPTVQPITASGFAASIALMVLFAGLPILLGGFWILKGLASLENKPARAPKG
ncbi:MAG: hypothetical protein R3C03_14720 [Pirellulaceae bacterium]